jgi:hypothetical protein
LAAAGAEAAAELGPVADGTAAVGPNANDAKSRFPLIGGKLFKLAGPKFPKFASDIPLISPLYSFSDDITGG